MRSIYLVTEEEIRKGLLDVQNANLKCLAFFRNFVGLEKIDLNNSKEVQSFIDNDSEEIALLQSLKDQIQNKLEPQNMFNYQVLMILPLLASNLNFKIKF